MEGGEQQHFVEPELAKKRGFRRALLWIAAFLLLVLVVVLGAGWWLLRPPQLTRAAERALAYIGIPGGLRVSDSSLDHIRLEQLHLDRDTSGCDTDAFFELASVDVYYHATRLLSREIAVDSIVVSNPNLSLCWQDSLLLPSWIALPADTVEQPEEESCEQGLGLRRLEGWSVSVEPAQLILRGLQLSASGSHQGKPFALGTPELDFSLRLPGIAPADWLVLDQRRLPVGFLADFLAQWNGTWRQQEEALTLALPGITDADSLQLKMRGSLSQRTSADLCVTADSLRFVASAELGMEELLIELHGDTQQLPRSLSCGLNLTLPLTEALAGIRPAGVLCEVQAALPDWNSELRLGAALDSLAVLEWELTLAQPLEALSGFLPFFLPQYFSEMQPFAGDLNLQGRGHLDPTTFSGAQRFHFGLDLDALSLPRYGVSLAQVHTAADFGCVLQDTLPTQMQLDAAFSLTDFALNTTALGIHGLPPRLQSIGCDTMSVEAQASLPVLEDSLSCSFDLSLGSLLDADYFLSLGASLPAVNELIALAGDTMLIADPLCALDVFASLPTWMFLESTRVPLEGLVEGVSGAVRLSAMSQSGGGQWQAEAALIPDGVELRTSEEAEWLPLPLHQLGTSLSYSTGQEELALFLKAPPLSAIQVQLCPLPQGVQIEATSTGLRLRELVDIAERLRVFEMPFGSRVEGELGVGFELVLNSDFMPDSASVRVTLDHMNAAHMGYQASDFSTQAGVRWTPSGVELGADWNLSHAGPEAQPALWSGLHGRLTAAAAADVTRLPELEGLLPAAWPAPARDPGRVANAQAEIEMHSLGWNADLNWQCADWRLPTQSTLVLNSHISTADTLVSPWPDVHLGGDLTQQLRVEPMDGDTLSLHFDTDGLLSEVRYEELARLSRLHVAFHFAQDLVPDPANPWLALQLQPPPVDWDLLRSLGRDEPREAPEAARGWALRVEEIEAMGVVIQQLALDLRAGQGRLDCPRFQCRLLDGEVRGAFRVAGWDPPEYGLWCTVTGVDSRQFSFGRKDEAVSRSTGPVPRADRLDVVLSLSGSGADLDALDQITGTMRFPELGREVTLNLLYALNQYSPDPNLGRISRLLNLPGFRYSVETLDFDMAHGFVRPQVALRKSFLSPLPDVSLPMSPLPLGFLVRNFALVEEEIQ